MNKEQAKAWLPLIQAVADGKTLQKAIYKFAQDSQGKDIYEWSDDFYELKELFNLELEFIRIKPEPKKGWYRVALLKNGTVRVVDSVENVVSKADGYGAEDYMMMATGFHEWLTDRIEYELPEVEA